MAKHDENCKNGKNGEFTQRRLETTDWLAKYPLNPYSVYHRKQAVGVFSCAKNIRLLNTYMAIIRSQKAYFHDKSELLCCSCLIDYQPECHHSSLGLNLAPNTITSRF